MDVLRLSADQHDWLQVLSSNDPIDDTNFCVFVEDVVNGILEPKRPFAILKKIRNDSPKQAEELVKIKQGIAGLSCLILEAAKRDSANDAVGLYLQAIGISEDRCKIIIQSYGARKNEFRQLLSTIGFSLPQVADVDWRLDYCIKSKENPHAAELRYQIDLKTFSQQDGFGNIGFSATTEELQEMLWKLKEAVKSVEKHAQS